MANEQLDSLGARFTANTFRKRISVGFVRPSDTTQYSIGDVVGPTGGGGAMQAFPGAGRAAGGGTGRIVEILMAVDLELITTATFRLHWFTKTHTTAADNAAFTTVAANFADYLGYIDPPILVTQAGGVAAAIRHTAGVSTTSAMPFNYQCAPGDSGLYLAIVALGTYTPKSAGLVRVSIVVEQD
jgi:hypothetical protein